MSTVEKKVLDLLAEHKLSKTKFRVCLLSYFFENHRPIKASEIYQSLQEKISFDRATLFRTLKDFTEKKILEKITLLNRSVFYEMSHSHHHHIVCKICGDIKSVQDCNLKNLEKRIQEKIGFHAINHSLEFSGICAHCWLL